MLATFFRLWIVITIGWWIYNLYQHRDKLSTLSNRNWGQALEYGLNNIVCDMKIFGSCRDIYVPFFQRTYVNETFGLIVAFVAWPLLLLLLCFVLAWVVRKPKRA